MKHHLPQGDCLSSRVVCEDIRDFSGRLNLKSPNLPKPQRNDLDDGNAGLRISTGVVPESVGGHWYESSGVSSLRECISAAR